MESATSIINKYLNQKEAKIVKYNISNYIIGP